MVANMARVGRFFVLSFCAVLVGGSVSADPLHCSFELLGQTLFDGPCDTEITRFGDGLLMVVAASREYFVYATQLELMSNGKSNCSSCETWDVTWNEEPYATHAHSPLGKAELVNESCLVGLDFKVCAK